ncbi:hypothetical protein BDW69DRAFT_157742 [Aspergillus filifer]
MSIEVNWGTATSGPDGDALAERIRSFIHDKFQQVPLPRFIRSVQVHSFDFGSVAPELEIKDFCEPFADFYEEDEDGSTSETSEDLQQPARDNPWDRTQSDETYRDDIHGTGQHPLRDPFDSDHRYHASSPLRSPVSLGDHLNPQFLPRVGTPGIPGGTSTLGYHLMSLGGLSGTQTPLAAVAGGSPFSNNWTEGNRNGNRPSPLHRADGDIDSSNPTSRPSTASTHPSGSNHNSGDASSHADELTQRLNEDPSSSSANPPFEPPPRMRERRPEDYQILCHAKYAGNIRLSLTAEILLDYPMPSFVGLPLKLNVTGMTFDGVAVIAHIRKRIHFCFLSPEDAEALVGSNSDPNQQESSTGPSGTTANIGNSNPNKGLGLLQEVRVESEIGRKEDGKQVLKNVGKVERFILAQVRRIFEEELVFPSFYTFLI